MHHNYCQQPSDNATVTSPLSADPGQSTVELDSCQQSSVAAELTVPLSPVPGHCQSTTSVAAELTTSVVRTPRKPVVITPRKQRYRQIINRLRVQLHQAKKRKAVAGKLNIRRNARINHIVEQAREFLPDLTLNFFKSQMKAFSNKRAQSMRWSEKDKLIALSIYYHGLRTYRFLSRLFQLPSVTSLRRWLHNITVHPGISKDILHILSRKFSNMTDMEQLCVLTFDEMSIKTALRYDNVNDCFIGLEDFGDGCRGKGLANQALVIMIRGLTSSWKQAIGYYLAAGGTRSTTLQRIVIQAIDLISNAGGHVKLMVCDQGSNNRALFGQLGVTIERPYFSHASGEIVCMFDPPHLFKSVRNNLLKYVFQIGDGQYADWKYIREFFDKDSKQALRLCPKLTVRHMELTNFSKMKVSYAVQVLSKSVAAGINTYVSLKALPDAASDTAKFLDAMDNLVDCFNSHSRYASTLKPHKHAISCDSVHIRFLQNALDWVGQWKPIGARSTVPCIHGLKLSISALIHLWRNVSTCHGLKFLMTSRLNQDCLENLFSLIRQAGGCRDSPNAEQFGQALRQCAVKSLLVVPKRANCVVDEDVLLMSLADLSCNKTASTQSDPTELLDMTCEGEEQVTHKQLTIVPEKLDVADFQSKVTDDNIVTYISGYLIKKISEIHSCSDPTCSVVGLHSNSAMFELPSQTFMYHKALQRERGDFGGLKCPSEIFVAFVTEMESTFLKEINGIYHIHGICRRLVYKIDGENTTMLPVCTEAVTKLRQLFLFMRLHAAAKFFSHDLVRQLNAKKNRKASKVMHL